MQITLSLSEILTIVIFLLGGSFTLIKIAAFQFGKNITLKLATIDKDIAEQSKVLLETTTDKIRLHRAEVELANERRHSSYLEKFHTKDEADARAIKQDKTADDIFKMLHAINEKFDTTISERECTERRKNC